MIHFQKDDIEHFEVELLEKEKTLKGNINEIAQLDEAILLIEEQQKQVQLERNQIELENKNTDNKSDNTTIDINGNNTISDADKTNENFIQTEINNLTEQTSNLLPTDNQEGKKQFSSEII